MARKVGHTGSLDPIATGVLPLCFGTATKFSQFLLNADKRYALTVKLGVATDSGDADGAVIDERPVSKFSRSDIERRLSAYRGSILQVPSMFSALKHEGQPLYKLARKGIEIEREARPISVYSNELVALRADEMELEIHCSKGTYVRTIVADLGEDLGCGAHVTALRRRSVGPFTEDEAYDVASLEAARAEHRLDGLLKPVASTVGEWPRVELNDLTAYHLKRGQPVLIPHAPVEGWVQLHKPGSEREQSFLGIGEVLEDGRIAPRRILT